MSGRSVEQARLMNDEKEIARKWLYDHNGGVAGGLGGLWDMVEQIVTARLDARNAAWSDLVASDAAASAEGDVVEYLRRFPATELQQPGIDAALVWLEIRPRAGAGGDRG